MYSSASSLTEDTLFVIVIYNCPLTQSAAFQSLCKTHNETQAKDIFVYDNSRAAQKIPLCDDIIHYYHNPANAGVSAAYNEAFKKARQLNKKWLLLADQDTRFAKEAVIMYEQNVGLYPNIGVFVPSLIDGSQLISPFRLKWGKGIQLKYRQPGVHSFRQWCVINSGLLISLNLFERSGGYDERFPLDFSDLAFIERLSSITKEFVWMEVACIHSLSAQQDIDTVTSVVLDRFRRYCAAATLFKKVSKKKVILSYLLLPRAVKLSWMKKNLRFIFSAFTTLFLK